MLAWSKRLIFPVLLALALAALGAAPAHAATPDLTCSFGSAYLTFGAPLQAGQTTDFAGYANVTGCTSGDGYSNLTGGPAEFFGTVTAAPGINPCSVILDLKFTGDIYWPNGQTTALAGTFSTNPADQPLGIGVKVTSGPLAGDTASALPVVVPNLDCLLVGLSSLSAPLFIVSFES